MRMWITGGAGFIGSHLCEKYTKEEHTMLCLDIFTQDERLIHGLGASFTTPQTLNPRSPSRSVDAKIIIEREIKDMLHKDGLLQIDR